MIFLASYGQRVFRAAALLPPRRRRADPHQRHAPVPRDGRRPPAARIHLASGALRPADSAARLLGRPQRDRPAPARRPRHLREDRPALSHPRTRAPLPRPHFHVVPNTKRKKFTWYNNWVSIGTLLYCEPIWNSWVPVLQPLKLLQFSGVRLGQVFFWFSSRCSCIHFFHQYPKYCL